MVLPRPSDSDRTAIVVSGLGSKAASVARKYGLHVEEFRAAQYTALNAIAAEYGK